MSKKKETTTSKLLSMRGFNVCWEDIVAECESIDCYVEDLETLLKTILEKVGDARYHGRGSWPFLLDWLEKEIEARVK